MSMSRLRIGLGGAVGLLLLAAADRVHAPVLVWNATASAPIGLYRVLHRTPRRNDLVLVPTPQSVTALAAARGYVPLHVPLVKRIAAMRGDRVCTQGDAVVVGRTVVALRVAFDHQARPLPYWEDCRSLRADEVFLLMRDAPYSFDSRYFGPVQTSTVIGVLEAIWTP